MLPKQLLQAIFLAAAVVAEAAPLASPQDAPTQQVQINQPNTTSEANLPITADFFAGAQGPKKCRGSPMLQVNLEKPGSLHTAAECHDLPEPASCGVFVASKEDGCEARLFADLGCKNFINLAVFMPEYRAVGGFFRSASIRCGVQGVAPAPLNFPGMKLNTHDRA